MQHMPIRLATVLAVLTAGMGAASIAMADPNLPTIPKHRHYLVIDSGRVEVGPRVCDNPRVQRAFNQFHSNNHVPVPGSPGPDGGNPGTQVVSGPCVAP